MLCILWDISKVSSKKGGLPLKLCSKRITRTHCLMYRLIKRYFRKKDTRKRLKEAVGKDRNEVKGGQHEKGNKRTATGYHQKQR